jgi:hypothetical protein
MSSPDPIASPASPRVRRALGIAFGVYLLLQIAIPAAYYLDRTADERFRWRMFSTAQYERASCTITVNEFRPSGDGAPQRLDLHRLLSAAMVRALGRHPERVGEALLRTRCQADASVEEVRLSRTCHREGQGSVQSEVTLDCRTGAFVRRSL